MPQENLTTIREACIKANPEIMELKFGCEVMYGDDVQEPRRVTIGNPYAVENNKVFNPWNRDDTSDLFEILGRPIRLADVLLAIKNMLIVVDAEGHFYRCEMKLSDKVPKIGKYLGEWNLRDDNLEHQTPETIAFIANLLSQ